MGRSSERASECQARAELAFRGRRSTAEFAIHDETLATRVSRGSAL